MDIDKEKAEANQAAEVLADWEEKLKTCKKTQSLITQERDPEGELAHLRSEVHRMQVLELTLSDGNVVLLAKLIFIALIKMVGSRILINKAAE